MHTGNQIKRLIASIPLHFENRGMVVRVPADWMVYADDRILEYLEEQGPASPTQITDDERIRISRTHANLRLKKLSSAGLTQLIGNGIYEITERGEGYLAGDFDARDLPDPDDSDS